MKGDKCLETKDVCADGKMIDFFNTTAKGVTQAFEFNLTLIKNLFWYPLKLIDFWKTPSIMKLTVLSNKTKLFIGGVFLAKNFTMNKNTCLCPKHSICVKYIF